MTVTVFGISAPTAVLSVMRFRIACLGGYSVWLAVNGMGGLTISGRSHNPLDFNVALALAWGHLSVRARHR